MGHPPFGDDVLHVSLVFREDAGDNPGYFKAARRIPNGIGELNRGITRHYAGCADFQTRNA
jgi:hypothetical protein